MVAAEEDRHPPLARHGVGVVVHRRAPARDLAEVAAALGQPRLHRHRRPARPRAACPVVHPVAELAEDAHEPGGPERLRAHQRAAGGGAELEPTPRNAMSRRFSAGGGSAVCTAVEHMLASVAQIRRATLASGTPANEKAGKLLGDRARIWRIRQT